MKTSTLKYIFALYAVTLVFVFTVSAFAQVPVAGSVPFVHWETDINAALSRGEKEQRPVFLHFVGNDCQPAQQMESEVFVHPEIVAQLNARFVMIKVNASENPALAQKFSVTAIPTDLIIQPNGQLVHRRTGGIIASRFLDYLAFLNTAIQQTASPVSATASSSAPSSSAPSSSAPPVAAAVQQTQIQQPQVQQPQSAVPVLLHDPFLPQPAPVVSAAPVSVPGPANPLRTVDIAANTAPIQPAPVQSSAQPSVTAQVNVPASPSPALPVVAGTAEPALPKDALPKDALSKDTVEVPLALEGFCPVTLCSEERWAIGNPAYCTMYQGQLFRFASPNALVEFAQNPAKYMPVAMGEDIVLMADRNQRVKGDRKFGAWFQDRVFLFANQQTLDAFAARPEYYQEIAIKYELARKEQPDIVVY